MPSPASVPTTRRGLASRTVAGLSAAVVAPLVAATDAEAVTKTPDVDPSRASQPVPTGSLSDRAFAASTVPTAASRHLANRFSYGLTPALHQQMRAAGTPLAWFERQLDPDSIPDAKTDAMQGWWTSINLDATQIFDRDRAEVESGWTAMANYARWCLLRRMYSERQVLEVMTEFWEHHLHVPVYDDGVFTYRAHYGKVIRSHALGRFDDMLVAAITHPAMLISLDNARSTKSAPNENLGRELLELHTVGKGHHTEDEVKASSRILTGHRVDTWTTWRSWYDASSHWTGAVKVLDFRHANTAADGRPVTDAYLRYLAHHPSTATKIARKLAVRFVCDDPPEALVARLAQVFLDHETEIKPVLRALVASPEFKASSGQKVRTPTDDVVATHRVLRTRISRPTSPESTANSILWQTFSLGQGPFSWGRPDGQPQDNRSWSSTSRLLASFDVHYAMSGGWWPVKQCAYRAPTSWLPAPSVRFDTLVSHLSTQVLGKPAPARLVRACSEATGVAASATITASHPVMRYQFPLVMTTLLDSPDHLHR